MEKHNHVFVRVCERNCHIELRLRDEETLERRVRREDANRGVKGQSVQGKTQRAAFKGLLCAQMLL